MLVILASWCAVVLQILILYSSSGYETLPKDIYLILGMLVMSKVNDSSDKLSIFLCMFASFCYVILYANFAKWSNNGEEESRYIQIAFLAVLPILMIVTDAITVVRIKLERSPDV